ncbi:MAG: M1 family metallopeptidase [Chloroflexi bacterium]|nr:M1 family metallopeptidase [Chloroflexota bacterium]MYD48452.1 M1 family metallopeptidase [Chloroflexota bacterium]
MPSADAVILPDNVRPVHYDLTLTPNFDEFTFDGEVDITVQMQPGTTEIVLNCAEIDIKSAAVSWADRDGEHTQEANGIAYDAEAETATISIAGTPADGPAGDQHLRMAFTGELNDKLRGFYRSQYTNPEGETAYLATTQFEATDARRSLPCWDEPAVKATFQVTLNVPAEMAAVSNTPIIEERPGSTAGTKTVVFDTTPIMSTYLLAFVIGDLTHIEKEAADGTVVGIWMTRGKEEQGQFALDTSVKLLSFFNDYFGIPYPLPKLDHLAIPDFAAGAMENWGCVTYRETALLVDPENSSAGTRQRVAEVVAHEMAHMWFGDLVTMDWWDDLWLNESFATWVGTKAVDWLFPEWSMWTQFVNMDTNRAFNLDGLKNSHPIEQEVLNPAEVSQLFDAISYSKGGSVLRMLENFLSPGAFRRGLNIYLNRHSYANARTTDLWRALEESSGQPVNTIMSSWTGQTGYPVLDVAASSAEGGLALEVKQERFVFDSILDDGSGDDEEQVWPVPLTVTAAGAGITATIVNAASDTITVDTPSQPEWFKVNPDQTGFYRVNYTDADWDRLAPAIAKQTLPATDRLGIQNDAYALAKAGLLGIGRFLSLAEAYQGETDASVWSDLATNLREIKGLIAEEPYLESFRAFGRGLFAPAAQRSGWEPQLGEGHLDSLLRSTVLSQAGSYGDAAVIAQAQALFDAYQQDPANVRPDLRGVVFSLVAQVGDRATYDRIWELERAAELHEEKIRMLMSLARFQQEDLLRETLDRALTDDVRLQDTIFVVSAVAANNRGRNLAWDFLKEKWDEFDRRYGSGGFGLMRLVAITNAFTSNEKRDDVAAFFEAHPTPAAERTIRQALERIALNVAWLERNRGELGRYFG